ncbi:hypothetical protein N7486_005870 [Penicillium sp. IBT 16267x]|nr:hypothetical protein N7486_005870 [Penicillium sp. IBT 16267x]
MPLSQESRIQMAISAYKKKQFRSPTAAAAMFGVPRTSLLNRLRGLKPRIETRANGHRLTVPEEEALTKQLLDADKRGFSIRPEFLRGMAQNLLCERVQDPTATLGVNWAYKFIKRHPALRTRYNRRISYQRAKQEDPKVIKQWFTTVREVIQEHGIHKDDIWNFDETGFTMGLCSTSKVITAVERSERPRRVIQGNREWVIIVECPLDVGVFGPLKRAYGKLVEEMMAAGNNHIDKEDFLSLYPPAREKVFTRENIRNGFAGAGLNPLNQDRVLKKVTFQLRTPTPPLIEVKGSISSAFQTPQNPRQLDQKAAQMAMNTNLLLQQQIKVLQAENERKTRKRARRRTTLGNDLILFVQEGQNRVQQLDTQLNEQVDEPTPRPRQRAPQRCSGCGIIGHTLDALPPFVSPENAALSSHPGAETPRVIQDSHLSVSLQSRGHPPVAVCEVSCYVYSKEITVDLATRLSRLPFARKTFPLKVADFPCSEASPVATLNNPCPPSSAPSDAPSRLHCVLALRIYALSLAFERLGLTIVVIIGFSGLFATNRWKSTACYGGESQ